MPDWSYQTLFRPALFRLPARPARDLALGFIGRLSRWPLGERVIDLLGHMRADRRLACAVRGVEFPTPIGLGPGFDSQLAAPRALARFGLGFLEVGPVTPDPVPCDGIDVDPRAEEFTLRSPDENPGVEAVAARLAELSHPRVPVFARLAVTDADPRKAEDAALRMLDRLGPLATAIVWRGRDFERHPELLERLAGASRAAGARLVLVALAPCADDAGVVGHLTGACQRGALDGIVIDGADQGGTAPPRWGRGAFAAARDAAARWRERLGRDAVIVASGGVHEPLQALQLRAAGADLVEIDSGIVFSGPGLPKRINDALLYARTAGETESAGDERPPLESWFWTLLMGLAMFFGGLLALAIATTRVVMPYDEAMAGMTRDEIAAVNPRLLDFMTHDRASLAGTMVAVGLLYTALSLCGSRRGLHWAHVAITASAFAGFASFFLFLGFGYFDPFHAFVTAILFQFLLLAVHADLPPRRDAVGPNLLNDRAWRLSQWGQLVFVVHGAALVLAGSVISAIGITDVFVPTDLEFMGTTAEHIHAAHPRLVPLVAHDRATFGGMLIACGITVLLAALWGYRRGHGWLWWSLMAGGHAAYLATILVHWHVGYMSLEHLVPAYAGLAMLWIGGALSYPYLCRRDAEHERLWGELMRGKAG